MQDQTSNRDITDLHVTKYFMQVVST